MSLGTFVQVIVVIMMTIVITMWALCSSSMVGGGSEYFLNLKHYESGNFLY